MRGSSHIGYAEECRRRRTPVTPTKGRNSQQGTEVGEGWGLGTPPQYQAPPRQPARFCLGSAEQGIQLRRKAAPAVKSVPQSLWAQRREVGGASPTLLLISWGTKNHSRRMAELRKAQAGGLFFAQTLANSRLAPPHPQYHPPPPASLFASTIREYEPLLMANTQRRPLNADLEQHPTHRRWRERVLKSGIC